MCGLARSMVFGLKSILLDTDDAALSKNDTGHDEDGHILYEDTMCNVEYKG